MARTKSGGRAVMIERGAPPRSFAGFLRAANVGGHQVFKPSQLPKALPSYRPRSIGAAGTFAFFDVSSERALRAALRLALPFEPELALVPGAAVARLALRAPFGAGAPPAGLGWFVSVLLAPPKLRPRLPVAAPPTGPWQIQLTEVDPPFALCKRRLDKPGKFYPNPLVERAFAVPATTRSWSTLLALARALAAG
jgi:hypothetical protein